MDRINGKQAHATAHENLQRPAIGEEQALLGWILRLQAWGWPARVEQTRLMAQELLTAKGDNKPIGVNWTQKFLSRHPEIKTAYVPPLDKERAIAQEPAILTEWFELYQSLKDKH